MTDLKKVLSTNVLALLDTEAPLEKHQRGIRRLAAKGFTVGTAQRILDGNTSVGLDILERLSVALGVAPWRLLLPGMQQTTPSKSPGTTKQSKAKRSSLELANAIERLSPSERTAIKKIVDRLASADGKIPPSTQSDADLFETNPGDA